MIDGILKYGLIAAVIGFVIFSISPCNFNNIKSDIPFLSDFIDDAECIEDSSTSVDSLINDNAQTLAQALLDIETNPGVVVEGNMTFYGKPTFDCTNNIHCREAFGISSMTCETETGRCFILNG